MKGGLYDLFVESGLCHWLGVRLRAGLHPVNGKYVGHGRKSVNLSWVDWVMLCVSWPELTALALAALIGTPILLVRIFRELWK